MINFNLTKEDVAEYAELFDTKASEEPQEDGNESEAVTA